MENSKKDGVGVIVARMQVAELTPGHKSLIKAVMARHHKTIIVLGVNGTGMSTKNNPLDLHTRKLMIEKMFPEVIVGRVKDASDDRDWSLALDEEIKTHITIGSEVKLYGGRDSFIPYYDGVFETEELTSAESISGTESRSNLRELVDKSSVDFRKGAIWATQNQYPTVYPTVDIAVIDSENDLVLLGKKPGEKKWRFPGGFVDVKKQYAAGALESTAIREIAEETCLDISSAKYLGSFYTQDGRYSGEVDCMMTSLFVSEYETNKAIAGDDLEEVKWFPLHIDTAEEVGPYTHVKMFNVLMNYLKGESNE